MKFITSFIGEGKHRGAPYSYSGRRHVPSRGIWVGWNDVVIMVSIVFVSKKPNGQKMSMAKQIGN